MLHLHITRVEVSLLPPDNPNRFLFTVAVESRDLENDRWAVCWHGRCLSRAGEWDEELIPSERREPWLVEHRFGYDEALRLAAEQAPTLRSNGRMVGEFADTGDGA